MAVFSVSAQQARSVRHYALILEDQAVADRFTNREATRSVAAENYRGQVRLSQANLRRELELRKIPVVGAVDTLSNALFVATTPDRVEELKALPGVKGVIAMRRVKPRMNQATTLANAKVAWTAAGGQSNAGNGILVGVIGSGIDQTHDAFKDTGYSLPKGWTSTICTDGHPEDCAYTNKKVIVARSYVRQLSVGSSTDATKVAADSGPDDYSPRDRSGHATAIASVIAGNSVTGPAVPFSGVAPKAWLGNYKVENSPGMPGGGGQSWESLYIQALDQAFTDGMQIVNLSSGVMATTGPLDTGSACGQATGVPCDYLASQFEKAAQLGMVITVSAGNDGENGYNFAYYLSPGFNTISSPANAPSVIAVGATMNGHVLQPSISLVGGPTALQNIAAQTSDAYSLIVAGYGEYVGAHVLPLIDAAKAGNDGYACSALPSYSLLNKIVLIQQGGGCDFSTKAGNAYDAGALGAIFYMNTSGSPTPVETQDSSGNIPLYGPVVMISQSDGQALKSYVDANGGSIRLDISGWEMPLAAYNTQAASLYSPGFSPSLASNQLLAFSSPGPDAGDLALKPDIVSTGGSDSFDGPAWNATDSSVLDYSFYAPNAMYMATQSYDASSDMYSSNGYISASGTSFSAPMVAGAAAVLWQLHPTYTATQIKALLMNTANSDTASLGDTWGNPADALNVGAGRLDMGAATQSAVIAQVVTSDSTNPVSVSFGAVTKLPVSKQILISNLGSSSATLAVAATAPQDAYATKATGATVAVDKSSVTVAAGGTATVTLTVSGTVPAADEYTGAVNITGTGVSIHVPYLFLVASGTAYDMQAIEYGQGVSAYGGCFEAVANSDAGEIGIKLVDEAGVPVTGASVAFTVSPRNSATLKSVSGEPTCSPSSSASSTTCKTDSYGIAWIDVVAGSSTSLNPLITASASGMSIEFGGTYSDGSPCGTVLAAPNVTSISESAQGSTSVAAGSYISIYGSNLGNPNELGLNSFNTALYNGDPFPFYPYPMSLDGVTASFDVPGKYDGKPADYNGYPAYFTYVSAGGTQLNVQIPWELQGASSALVKVTVDGVVDSNVLTVPLATYAPQWFQCGTVVCAIDATTWAASATAVSASNPAHAGDVVELYGNGFGPVNNQPASGAPASSDAASLATTKSPCTVTVGGVNATVAYCGLAPGDPAEYQVNIVVPSGLAAGNQPVIVTTGGASSKALNLPIK